LGLGCKPSGMQDTELYESILGLRSPWGVTKVTLELESQRIEVEVGHVAGERFACPQCGALCAVHDHGEERTWRHLDSCQYRTLLRARPPRVRCKEHGVRQVELPWASPRGQFTLLFEGFAIQLLRATDVQSAARLLGISWDQAWGIMSRAVTRGQKRKAAEPTEQQAITLVAVDEKSPGKREDYFTVVSDLQRKTVQWIGDGRKAEVLDGYWQSRSAESLGAIRAVAMDMSGAYFASTVRSVPDGQNKVVYDRFHVMQHASKAVDQVRRNEHVALSRKGDSPLAKSRHMWLFSLENLPEKHADAFQRLRQLDLLTAKAWALKETLRRLWSQPTKQLANLFLWRWIRAAKRVRLAPLARLASTLKSHRHNLLTYFDFPITNAAAEGLNSRIQLLKAKARGYRNRQNFKTAIFFHLGGLSLEPVNPL
jgi:transposase